MKRNDQINKGLLKFIEKSPTAFHAANNAADLLREHGFTELRESERWHLEAPGKYFPLRNGSSVIAFRVPEGGFENYLLYAAHTDSPCLKIKEEPETRAADCYTRLNVEKYGGMIHYTWLDRPLSAAGRITVRVKDGVETKLVDLEKEIALVPSVAIHMEKTVNDGKAFNMNVDMLPLAGGKEPGRTLRALAAEKAGVAEGEILSTDLFLYPRIPGIVWGEDGEFITSPRLDDLECLYAGLVGFLEAEPKGSCAVFCAFDNEEVGSGTKQGAGSDMLDRVLARVSGCFGLDGDGHAAALAGSFMISADNAHAVHPNHPEYADRIDRPVMNEGIVIKYHAGQKYTTDSFSAAVFASVCEKAGVPVQRYTNRADLPGGSTLGNISNAHVSVSTVDVGLAQLSMHSCCETAGGKDAAYLVRAAKAYFSCSFRDLGKGRWRI